MHPKRVVWPRLPYLAHRLMVLEAAMGDASHLTEDLHDEGFYGAMDQAFDRAAATSLKAAADIAKTLGALKSISDVQGKLIELQSKILAAQSSALAAQSELAAMLQRVSELEKELTRIKAWEDQKDRYKLENAWDQNPALVYKLKSSSKPAETAHWILLPAR